MKYPINLERLMEVKQKRFINAFRKMKFTREEMGWFLQFVLEKYVFDIISKHKITNLMVAGGCFYNVRLNGRIAKYMDRFSVMPLAGDQGAAIGAYREYAGKGRFRFGDLCWGTRPDTITPMDQLGMTNFQVFKQKEFPYVIKEIADKLNNGEIVNIMRGEMEFGPRALCKTTTLAPPTMKHVEAINDLNDRNTVMPMAPVMTHGASRRLFDKKILTSVIGTDRFMVCAHEFQHGKGEEVSGAALKDGEAYTGRPQIVDVMTDATMVALLEMVNYECLINTSLNLHGDPIIFDIAGLRRVHATWLTRHTLKQPAFSTYCFV
jgi:carbamoyltransferase